ncbi:DNA-3-methyladenine glycosylase family protein [Neoasaia chiangmaiensis]|uniref:DNA-3-methyladenine glycosylase II n=1 Tax=Neoasaia chiangmaiensis TaxID=320497 RepID=A0A1U9KPW4_9PROT|nr:DNA-3-methyladenine glycosylase [Neoasaia chiangmaiensis]AQS87805.1 DNA-3-methyladenine glycosylase [Neoasaia chiangmaiensis]
MHDVFPAHDPALKQCLSTDPDLAALLERIGPCRLRGDDGMAPYEALLRAITGQQLHARAAQAILGRVKTLAGGDFPTPDQLLTLPDADWRSCGLSAAKLAAMRGVAQARLDGLVPSRQDADGMSDDELIGRFVTLRGIGRWTVQMLLIFTLNRPDVMPVDDFGVRAGWRKIKRLEAMPSPGVLYKATLGFSPYRSALAWYLWRASEEGKAVQNPLTG